LQQDRTIETVSLQATSTDTAPGAMAPDAIEELQEDQSNIDGPAAGLLPITGLPHVTGAAANAMVKNCPHGHPANRKLTSDPDDGAALDRLGDDAGGKRLKISTPSEGAANAKCTSRLDLDEAAVDAHVTQDNGEEQAMPIETTDWRIKKSFWEMQGCYMQDRHGDPDRDFEAYARSGTGIRPRKFSTPLAP